MSSSKLPFRLNNFQSNARGGGKLFLNCIGHRNAVSRFNRFVSSTICSGCVCAPFPLDVFFFFFVLAGSTAGLFFVVVVVFIVGAAVARFSVLRRRSSFSFSFSSSAGSALALFDRPRRGAVVVVSIVFFFDLSSSSSGGSTLALFPRALRRGGMTVRTQMRESNFSSKSPKSNFNSFFLVLLFRVLEKKRRRERIWDRIAPAFCRRHY